MMYRGKYDTEWSHETNYGKRLFLWFVVATFLVSGAAWLFSRTVQVADTAIIRYEEFQEMYNTTQKVNTDLGVIRAVPEDDRMFAAFSKAAMIAQKQQQMARWVEEYNAKSRMWNRALWKSQSLPYQLDVNDFSNFKGDGR